MRAPIPFLQISGGLLLTTPTTTSLTAFSLDSGSQVWNFEIPAAPAPENQPQTKKRKISEAEPKDAPVEDVKVEAAPVAAAAETEAPATTTTAQTAKVEKPKKKGWRDDVDRQISTISSCDAEDGTGYVAIGMTDKFFLVLAVKSGQTEPELIYKTIVPKRPSSIKVIPSESLILYCDKFGDVFSLPLPTAPPAELPTPVLVLGHVSMLLDLEFARLPTDPSKKVILTSDRDEHIRITRFPQGHIIEGYLLGHTQFVNNICVIQGTDFAISGGGDGELKLWKWWSEKKEIASLNLNSVLGNEGEDGTSDRTVKGIWQIGTGGKIAVAIEKVAALLIFEVTDDGFKLLGNVQLKGNALDTVIDLEKGVAWVSIDPEQEGEVAIQKISLENWQVVEDEQTQTINTITATKDEGYKGSQWGELYKAKVLRKFEGEGENN